MRKAFAWMSILLLIPLVGCSLSVNNPQKQVFAITPTKSGVQMQTEISQMLTLMPTGTGQPAAQVSPTAVLPTVIVITATQEPAAPVQASATPTTPPAATSTSAPAPQPSATATQQNAAAPAQAATATGTAAPASATLSGDEPAWLSQATKVTDNMDSDRAWNWPTGSDAYTQAVFAGGQQEITALTTKDGWRLANPKSNDFSGISNMYLRATFKIEKCHTDSAPMADHYGLIVRVPQLYQPDRGYLLGFNCNGDYSLRSWIWNGDDIRRQTMQMLIPWTASNLINAGANKTNVMGIETSGTVLRLYANGHLLPASYDYNNKSIGGTPVPQLATGYFGVFVGSRTNVDSRTDDDYKVWVDDMSYWIHP